MSYGRTMQTIDNVRPRPRLRRAPQYGLATWIHLASLVAFSFLADVVHGESVSDLQASELAKLALDGLHREYPNKPSNVVTSDADVLPPSQLHPAFYGCFDWHSSVHGHWMLVRLLKTNPKHALVGASREALSRSLTTDSIAAETAYFASKENQSFERMYGWAWLLRLVTELEGWDDADGRRWRETLRPLEQRIVELTLGYLPRLSNPIRTGVHPDTAFALSQILDYARAVKQAPLEALIVQRSREYYLQDRDYPSRYEPSGEDFFSACLNEADLMRRILSPGEFAVWLDRFLVVTGPDSHASLLTPVAVSDVTDGKLVHLAGLNLSRAWCFYGILEALPVDSIRAKGFHDAAQSHEKAGLHYVFSGHYEGEHWLGTFAVYTLTRVGTR